MEKVREKIKKERQNERKKRLDERENENKEHLVAASMGAYINCTHSGNIGKHF